MEWLNNAVTQQVIAAAVPVLMPVLVAVITWVVALFGKWVVKMIQQSESKLDDRLAAMAVAWAEDQYKPDTGKGVEKLQAACDKLQDLTGGRIKSEQAETLIRAAYQSLMGSLAPLKNA